MKAKPFIKWAGGKKQLLAELNIKYPLELRTGMIDTYVEPFIGGGAVFFDIIQKFSIKNAFISDINQDLILTYLTIR